MNFVYWLNLCWHSKQSGLLRATHHRKFEAPLSSRFPWNTPSFSQNQILLNKIMHLCATFHAIELASNKQKSKKFWLSIKSVGKCGFWSERKRNMNCNIWFMYFFVLFLSISYGFVCCCSYCYSSSCQRVNVAWEIFINDCLRVFCFWLSDHQRVISSLMVAFCVCAVYFFPLVLHSKWIRLLPFYIS